MKGNKIPAATIQTVADGIVASLDVDPETQRLLLNDIARLRANAQSASISGYDEAARRLLDTAAQKEKLLKSRCSCS
jgi:hypothetical protein